MDDDLIVSLKRPQEVASHSPKQPTGKRRRPSRMWLLYVAVLVCAALLVGFVYWHDRSQGSPSIPTSAGAAKAGSTTPERAKAAVERSVEDLVIEVGKLILLPENETPTIATVSDPSKLSDQAFFAHAKVGDKVLLYTKAGKAYLYDPTARRLVEVAPITTQAK